MIKHLSAVELEAGLAEIYDAPKRQGRLEMIVRRPEVGDREEMPEGTLDVELGLVGDNWRTRPHTRGRDGLPNPEKQLNIMSARAVALVAQGRHRWSLAGDQLFLDFDLSEENLPVGTQLTIGEAAIEVTPVPHLGCEKFVSRFGLDAMKFVNSTTGKALRLRGLNAKVVRPGVIRVGDVVTKL